MYALTTLRTTGELGHQWGQRSAQAASSSLNYWWERYEEFVGINEVRVAQTRVNEAESAFMVSRGMVREAHGSLEVLQVRLKEVRDRLDRVSREEAHYLELATQEHRLLQGELNEERRLRTAYENAEGSEREKFALFSAGVRASHEKERTRAERTKNWSIIGSVLGALIGVMGSTYINRVRLQELKNLLLEAQKGPESLQEALKVQAGNHRLQQDEFRSLIDTPETRSERRFLSAGRRPPAGQQTHNIRPSLRPLSALKELHVSSKRTETLLEKMLPQLGSMEEGMGRMEGRMMVLLLETNKGNGEKGPMESEVLVRRLEETQRTLGERIRTNNVYNAVFTFSATAITVATVYLLLRGSA
ncbi:hypothetical protein KUCAC02_013412 [Chaenocephalus aceratus]|nr:hypothetical protein KUCAC02_013412 [Chaenocephalus aceratus]